MRKHLSVLALAARGTVWRVLTVTLLAAVLSGALLWPAQPSPVPQALPPCWRC